MRHFDTVFPEGRDHMRMTNFHRARISALEPVASRVLSFLVISAIVLSSFVAIAAPAPAFAQDDLEGDSGAEAPFVTMPIAAGATSEGGEGEISASEAHVTFNVQTTTLADEWDTNPNTSKNTKCSLREALQMTVTGANPLGNQGCGNKPNGVTKVVVNLQGGTYLLTRAEPLPTMQGNVEVLAQGAVTIDGNGNARSEGILIVLNCGDCQDPGPGDDQLVTLPKMTLQNGKAVRGAALWIKDGSVTAREVTFTRNIAVHPDAAVKTEQGGAVRVDAGGGDFVCIKCIWRENTSRGTGGALSSGGVGVILDRNEFIGNHADYGGGAIQAAGGGESYPIIMDSKFKENFVAVPEANQAGPGAENGGGAILSHGKMLIQRSEFYGNYTMKSKGGGAIRVNGELRVEDSAFQNNQARKQGSGEITFGGAVLVEGGASAFFVRTSMHHNEAFNGGAMAVIGGEGWLINSSVANNNAAFDGGVAVNFQPSWLTGEAYIVHSSLARNEDNTPDPLQINSANNYAIYMANSIIDSACGGPTINSGGGNIYKGMCARVPWEPSNDQTNTDHMVEYVPDIGFEGMNNNGGPSFQDAYFLSMKVDTDSPAVDLSVASWCQDATLVEAQDQIGGARPNGTECDSGAMEVGSNPPKFESTPAAGQPILFPAVMLGGGATQTTRELQIKNTGGGVIQWEATIDEGWDGTFEVGGAQTAGGLAKNQSATLTLTCKPSNAGSYYGMLLITTSLQDQPEVRYKLTCHSPNLNSPYAGAQQKPGPMSAGQAAPGETTMVSANIGNPGSQPLQATYNWKQTAGNVWQLTGNVSAVSAADGSATVSIPPGDQLDLTMSCKPDIEGVFSNQVEITTNDPLNPVITYDIGCEGRQDPDPEKLEIGESWGVGLGKRGLGIDISPDGRTLIAGLWDDAAVGVYARNPENGTMSLINSLQVPGMAGVSNVAFSPDGKSAYWTSTSGDGVVHAQVGENSAVTFVDQFTSSTLRGCVLNGQPTLCPFGTMDGARGVAVSPDGLHVYVTGQNDDSLTVLSRNPANGELTYQQTFIGLVANQPVLNGASGVLVSHDGYTVYVAARNHHGVAVFSRGSNGDLAFIQAIDNSMPGISGLEGAFELAESPDGKFIYVGSNTGGAVVTFARTPGDGMLSFVESVPVGTGPYALEMSHDERGERLLVALWQGDGVVNLARDYHTGKLTPIETISMGPDAPKLDGVVDIVSSADDKYTYVTLWADSAANNDWTVTRLINKQNPPSMGNISPASRTVGSSEFVLTVNGARFYPGSIVQWNGAALPTTFVSEFELNATVDAGKLGAAGNVNVTVLNQGPGGGASTAAVFNVLAAGVMPTPSVESLNPPAAEYGNEALNVVVTGAGFLPTSQALLNGAPVETLYVGGATLVVLLSASDITSPGPLAITVVNDSNAASAAGEVFAADAEAIKRSTAVAFTTSAPNEPAQPAIRGFRPASLIEGSGEQWITVLGSGFSTHSGQVTVARWNGDARESSVVDEGTLLVKLTAADLAAATIGKITAFTPGLPSSAPGNFKVLATGSNPAPSLDSYYLDFSSGGVKAVVSGNDFVTGATVVVNGSQRVVTVVNPYVAVVNLNYADVQRSSNLRIVNAGPGGGSSNTLVLGEPLQISFMPVIGR